MSAQADERDFVEKWLDSKIADPLANQDVLKAIATHQVSATPQERELVNLIVSLADECETNNVVDKAD